MEKDEYRILVKEKDSIEEFYIKKKIDGNIHDCNGCPINKYCCKLEYVDKVFFSSDDGKSYRSIKDFCCEDKNEEYELIYWVKNNRKKPKKKSSYLIKKVIGHQYGDDEDHIDEGIVYISPSEIIENFCKKFCPGYKEELVCMESLSCPFYKIFKEIYEHVK